MASSSSFPLQIFTSVNDVEELESFSIPKLVAYLKTSSRTECFKTVENVLISREEKLKFEKEEVMKVVEGLEKELRAYEDSCLKWSMGVGKLESEKSEIESDFKEEVQRHEEDFNVYRERERRAIERIRNLSSELQNVTREKNKEIIELKTKNKEVECKKRKVEDERDMLKRRLVGMVKQVTNLENECAKLTLQFEAIEDSEKEETYGEENRAFYTAGGDSLYRSLAERSDSGQAGDPPTVNLLSKPLANQKEERKCPASPELVSQRSTYENVVVITDSESENEATHAEKLPKKCVIKTSFSQKDIENGNSHKEKYPSVSSRKRRRMVLSSDSEDDDQIPIGNLEMRTLEEGHHHSDSFGKQKFMASTVSYGIDKSRKAGKIPMKPFETDGTSSRKRRRMVLSSDSEDDDRIPIGNLEMKKLEEVHHHSDSFGNQKFMASTVSYGIDKSRNAGKIPMKPFEMDGTFLSGIQSWKANGLKWHYEFDMLTSFEKDPRVCMRAICALYGQHILEKKAVAASGHPPNRGFCKVDEQRATFLVEFLLDGNPDGEMKKSVEELKRYSPNGIDDCVRLAKKYSRQLFTIYKNKEDPFFCE